MLFNSIIKKIITFFLANVLILLHLTWRITFHQPIDLLNIVILIFLWLIILNPHRQFILAATYTLLVCELFYTSPFGLESFAQISALLFSNWLLLYVFTNRSLVIVFFVGFITMAMYRVTYIILIFFNSIIQNKTTEIYSVPVLTIFLKEALITTLTLTIVYLISSLFIKRLRPEYILDTSRII